MNSIKYLTGISIMGLILVLSLSANVSAMAQITIGDATHNFTVVPGQEADITLPITVKNASDNPIRGLQFNVTFNCSMINITNITETSIVDVPTGARTELYNKYCNGSAFNLGSGILGIWCFFVNTTLTQDNKTNASVMSAMVKDLGNGTCILRIAFASYKDLTGNDVVIGKVKMKVKGMPNYFNTNYTLLLNVTVEKMGKNHTTNINVSDANIHSQARINGLVKACRGDANQDGEIDVTDVLYLAQYTVNLRNLNNIRECLDVSGDNDVDVTDLLYVAQSTVGLRNLNIY